MTDLVESLSGVRGIAGRSITDDLAYRYGYSFARWLMRRHDRTSVVVARDPRATSPSLARAFQRGLRQGGATKLIDVGVQTTPAAFLSIPWLRAHGGVMVTASHNEPAYNGWKLIREDGSILYPGEAETIRRAVHRSASEVGPGRAVPSTHRVRETRQRYLRYLLSFLSARDRSQIRKAQLRVVVDPNGGAAAVMLRPLLHSLGVRSYELGMRLGEFRRKVEPVPAALNELARKVQRQRADFGIGFDCDADRATVVMPAADRLHPNGALSGSELLALIVDEFLRTARTQTTVVVNDATTSAIAHVARSHGARLREVEVGEINVLRAMDAERHAIGGEGTNGGVIIPPGRSRDGLVATVMLLRLLAAKRTPLASLVSALPQAATIHAKVRVEQRRADGLYPRLLRTTRAKVKRVQLRGGSTGSIKAFVPGGWFWFRGSKTEPGIYRIIVEAGTHAAAKRLLSAARSTFRRAAKR